MDKVLEVTCCIWSYSYLMNEIKSCAQDGYAQVIKIKVDMLAPSLGEDWNTRLRIERDQLKRFNFVILLNLS